ncbi:MAG: shikimate kinase [Chloroflexota bacterium]
MSNPPPVRLFLVGMMGSGKTTVGRALAARTGWPYVDNDALLQAATGKGAPELIAELGETGLHAGEVAAFEHAAALPPPIIASIAGGVIDSDSARRQLAVAGTVVWLRARPETLLARVGGGVGRRPSAVSTDWVKETAEAREGLYRSVARIVADVDDRTPDEIADAIVRSLHASSA